MMDLSLLIVNIVAGGFVGYVTKTLAINMLFKKYPVIGGAEIIKDRENLEISMSTLVEERLIKPETMLEEFQKDEFKKSFEKLINHIVSDTINENIKKLDTVDDLQGFEETSENLRQFLISKQDEIILPCVESLLNHVLISDLMSREQLKNLVEKLLLILSGYLLENIKEIIHDFALEIKDKTFAEFVSTELLQKLAKNAVPEKIHHLIEDELLPSLEKYLDQAREMVGIEKILKQLETQLKEKTLKELLGAPENSKEKPSEHIINRLIIFLGSEKGKLILNDFMHHLLSVLKSLDIPLSALLTPEIEEKILVFVERHLPGLIERLEVWVAMNKLEMEKMINSAIEEHLESENLVKQIIGTIFVQKLAERYQLVEGTLNELKDLARKTGPNIINLVNRFLDNTKISDLAGFLEKNLFDDEALGELVLDLLKAYLPRLNIAEFDLWMEIKLGDIPIFGNFDLVAIFNNQLYPQLLEQLKKNWLLNPEFSQIIKNLLEKSVFKLSELKLSSLLTERSISNYSEFLLPVIASRQVQNTIVEKITESVPELVAGKTINQVLSPDVKADIFPKLSLLYREKIGNFILTLKKEKVASLYRRTSRLYADLCKNFQFARQLTDTLVGMMVVLIRKNRLLEGKIYLAIKESFSKFSDDELKAEMDNFMGQELKPIKLLGTFLGAVVGILMYWISFVPGYNVYVKGYWALFSYSLSYAISEVGTNWLAIKMLFRPYQAVKIAGTKISLPFTPGVFPKNKKALADSMVNFIDKKLLSKDNMVRILEKYHPKWKEVIKEVVAKNDYQVVDETINRYARENYDTVSPMVFSLGFKEINLNREEVAAYIAAEVNKVSLDNIELPALKKEIGQKIDESGILLKNTLTNELFGPNVDFNKNFSQAFPEKFFREFTLLLSDFGNQLTDEFAKVMEDETKFNAYTENLFQKIDVLLEKKPGELLSEQFINDSTNSVLDYLEEQIKMRENQELILNYLERKFFNRENRFWEQELGKMLDGKLISTILKESDVIMDFFSNYLLNLSKSKKNDLVKMILSDIEKKGILETFLVRFGGIRNDVKGIVDVLVDHKLQPYLEHKKNELRDLFHQYIENTVAFIKLEEVGLSEAVFNLSKIKKILRKNVLNNPQIISVLKQLLRAVLDDITKNLTSREIMESIKTGSSAEVVAKFGPEIRELRLLLRDNLLTNKKIIVAETLSLSLEVLEQSIFAQPFNKLLKNVGKQEVMDNIGKLTDLIYQTNTFSKYKIEIIDYLFEKIRTNIPEILDLDVLKRDISQMIEELTSLENTRLNGFQQEIQSSVKEITIKFVEVLNENIEHETKHHIEEILVDSLVDSLRINNREILEPIDFEAIVRKEVNQMEPARIESLFDFAKPIFRLLIWYGAFGGIIGLAVGFFEAFR